MDVSSQSTSTLDSILAWTEHELVFSRLFADAEETSDDEDFLCLNFLKDRASNAFDISAVSSFAANDLKLLWLFSLSLLNTWPTENGTPGVDFRKMGAANLELFNGLCLFFTIKVAGFRRNSFFSLTCSLAGRTNVDFFGIEVKFSLAGRRTFLFVELSFLQPHVRSTKDLRLFEWHNLGLLFAVWLSDLERSLVFLHKRISLHSLQ
jgi:hypothetical protein